MIHWTICSGSKRYVDYKATKSLLDYDDLTKLKDLLSNQEEVRRRLSQIYQFIMVDEYQDTNALQAQIIRLLAATHNNVAVVGDDAQSIYSFRGANFRNIMDFPEAFPGTRIIKLEENYRSTQPILNLTNKIIQLAKERYDKRLFTHKQEGETPVLVQAESEQMQSRFVCQKILELREEACRSDIAVLFRSSFHSFDLELELARHIFRLSSKRRFPVHGNYSYQGSLGPFAHPRQSTGYDFVEPGFAALGGSRAANEPEDHRLALLAGSQLQGAFAHLSSQSQDCPRTQNLGPGLTIRVASRTARGADALSDAVLRAHP